MDGFEKLIDIFGGVDVKSNATFEYNGSQFKQGESMHLNSKRHWIMCEVEKKMAQVVMKVEQNVKDKS